jgi:Bifunctional DNA primase/polymerase, N-terminal
MSDPRIVNIVHGYNARGWATFPLREGRKDPLSVAAKNGCNSASADFAINRPLFLQHRNANVGVATGKPSGGLCILDADVDPDKGIDGPASLRALCAAIGLRLPQTLIQRTGGGGWQLVFYSARSRARSEGLDVA